MRMVMNISRLFNDNTQGAVMRDEDNLDDRTGVADHNLQGFFSFVKM